MPNMQPAPEHAKAIANWLLACILMVALMVAVGGVTRLTESGLSIVKWKLVSGILPPMNEESWQVEFDGYKQTPQYKKVNSDFQVTDFKRIFWLEYLHRLIGRAIGLVIFVPLIYFFARRQLTCALVKRCFLIFVLVGAQGAVGWVMVASGLNDQPRVEPLKLAAHLLLAFSVFGVMLWTRWQVLGVERPVTSRCIAKLARLTLALLLIQITFGALVAGLRAGLTYNTYPLMDGQLIPSGLHLLQPWWLNHVENVLTVQFQHRMMALLVVISAIALVIHGWKQQNLRTELRMILIAILSQFALGIATLLSHVEIPLASAHQLVALVLVALLVRLVYLTPLGTHHHTK
jgi:cytochrome c oxidase assembly protein subunit 15